MRGEDLLHRSRGEAMSGDVDDVVDAPHDVDVAILVPEPAVASQVVAGKARQVPAPVSLVVAPHRGKRSGRERQADGDASGLPGSDVVALVVDNAHVVSGSRLRRRAGLHREKLDADRVAADGPARLRLPPVIDDRDAQLLLRPEERVGIAALAGEEERAQLRQIVSLDVLAAGVVALDRPEGRGRGEERAHLVLRTDAPEGARIGRPDRLPLVKDGGAAL